MKNAAKKTSSKSLKRYTFSHINFIVFVLIFAGIGGYLLVQAFAWTTNEVALDGIFKQGVESCQSGQSAAASPTVTNNNKPVFNISGDGPLSSYQAFIDGASIGNFNANANGNSVVCIAAPNILNDGAHIFTATEIGPQAGKQTVPNPYNFTIDTVAPANPSTPLLSAYSDSGIVGDKITKYRNINFTGTAEPGASVTIYNGPTAVAGGLTDANGNWSATTISLADGTYNLYAQAHDHANNSSASTSSISVTIDQNAPEPGTGTPVPGDANGDGHVSQADLTILAANFGTSASFCDFNHDSTVNFLDLSIILTNYGR